MVASVPELRLPEWTAGHGDAWTALAERAARLTTRAGMGADFAELVDQVRKMLAEGDWERVRLRLTERRFARALATVWLDDDELAAQSLRAARIEELVGAQAAPPSRLMATTLASLVLKYFDLLDAWEFGLFATVARAVRMSVRHQRARSDFPDLVEAMRQDPTYLLERQGPQRLAETLTARGASLKDYMRDRGVVGFDSWRFGELVRQAYYLTQIRAADHTRGDHDFLAEITSRPLTRIPGRGGLMFGHEVLEALADKPEGTASEEWLQAILDIGGDPRLTHTAQWGTWWQPIPERLIRRVTVWLSAEDLRLFLMAVENFGQENFVSNLNRLFPPRKKFLLGLYDSGLVKETRLILGSNVRTSVRRQVGRIRTDAAGLETMSDTAIIYIDCGDFQIVEGSHHFRMWIYVGQPVPTLSDRSKAWFTGDELRHDIPYRHDQLNRDVPNSRTDIVHNGFWQRKALEFLIEDHGMLVDPQAVLTSEDYTDLKRRYGLPVPRQRKRVR